MSTIRKKDQKDRFAVILCNPEKPENLGLIARAMQNTGFKNLRLVRSINLDPRAYLTAVHSKDVLDGALFVENGLTMWCLCCIGVQVFFRPIE